MSQARKRAAARCQCQPQLMVRGIPIQSFGIGSRGRRLEMLHSLHRAFKIGNDKHKWSRRETMTRSLRGGYRGSETRRRRAVSISPTPSCSSTRTELPRRSRVGTTFDTRLASISNNGVKAKSTILDVDGARSNTQLGTVLLAGQVYLRKPRENQEQST